MLSWDPERIRIIIGTFVFDPFHRAWIKPHFIYKKNIFKLYLWYMDISCTNSDRSQFESSLCVVVVRASEIVTKCLFSSNIFNCSSSLGMSGSNEQCSWTNQYLVPSKSLSMIVKFWSCPSFPTGTTSRPPLANWSSS